MLQFGTEVIASKDGSMSGLLGASPGASTAAPIMINVLERCFPDKADQWRAKLEEIVPSYGMKLSDKPREAKASQRRTAKVLGLSAKR